jgi:hypothetical protein
MKYSVSHISVQKDSKMECGQKATGTVHNRKLMAIIDKVYS